MTQIEKLTRQIKAGKPLLNAYNNMSDKEIKKRLKKLFGTYFANINTSLLFSDKSEVIRTIRNMKIEKIEILYSEICEGDMTNYSISIDLFGIQYNPEHKHPVVIVEFDKNFKP